MAKVLGELEREEIRRRVQNMDECEIECALREVPIGMLLIEVARKCNTQENQLAELHRMVENWKKGE